MDIQIMKPEGEVSPVFHNVTHFTFGDTDTATGKPGFIYIFSSINGNVLRSEVDIKNAIGVNEYQLTMGEILRGLWSELKEFGSIIWQCLKRQCTKKRRF